MTVGPENAISLSLWTCDFLPQSSNDNTALTFYQNMTMDISYQSYDTEAGLGLKVR